MPLLPSNRKGLGAKIEGRNVKTTFAFEKLELGEVPADVSSHSLEQFIPKGPTGLPVIMSQGATSSCVAHAFCAAIHIAEERAGLPFIHASRLFAYYNARREQGLRIVTDDGTYLRTCAEGLRHFGLPDEKHWPFSTFTLNVNKRPNFDAYRWSQPRANGRYVKIYQRDAPRIMAIKQALFAGHAVVFGMLVNSRFLEDNLEFNIADMSKQNIVGGHAMAIVGWKTEGGSTWFRIQNSWGMRWRDRGMCWIHEDMIATEDLSDDFHVIYGWNRLQEGR